MIQLSKALSAWPSPEFEAVMKQEIECLDADLLPLQQGLSQSSHARSDKLSARIISVVEETDCLRVKAGLFYTGIIAGCSCADDPTPVDEINEYCEVRFDIDKQSAETRVVLLAD
ncbi:MAG: hypothetical protein Q8O33_02630 [Pseudomonadota bacterium]|nr:hypothetical protein [Pseudomonadota bacterium]